MSIADCISLWERHADVTAAKPRAAEIRKIASRYAPPSAQEIRRIVALSRIKRACGARPHPPAVLRALWDDYKELGTLRAVAARYGTTHSAIGYLFRRHKMPSIRKPSRSSVVVNGLKYTTDNRGYYVGCRRYDMGKPLHKILWEQANGPVPAGHRLIFVDRNPANYALTNIRCVDHLTYWRHVRAARTRKFHAQ